MRSRIEKTVAIEPHRGIPLNVTGRVESVCRGVEFRGVELKI
jgi:hypothetical protein